jgi:hypothetical protein
VRNPSIVFGILDDEIRSNIPIVVDLRMGDYLSLKDLYGAIGIKFIRERTAFLAS